MARPARMRLGPDTGSVENRIGVFAVILDPPLDETAKKVGFLTAAGRRVRNFLFLDVAQESTGLVNVFWTPSIMEYIQRGRSQGVCEAAPVCMPSPAPSPMCMTSPYSRPHPLTPLVPNSKRSTVVVMLVSIAMPIPLGFKGLAKQLSKVVRGRAKSRSMELKHGEKG